MISRRGLITGLISFVAAPAIVRAGSLMPVKVMGEIDWNEMSQLIHWQINVAYEETLSAFTINLYTEGSAFLKIHEFGVERLDPRDVYLGSISGE